MAAISDKINGIVPFSQESDGPVSFTGLTAADQHGFHAADFLADISSMEIPPVTADELEDIDFHRWTIDELYTIDYRKNEAVAKANVSSSRLNAGEEAKKEGANKDDNDDVLFVGHGVLDEDELKADEDDGEETEDFHGWTSDELNNIDVTKNEALRKYVALAQSFGLPMEVPPVTYTELEKTQLKVDLDHSYFVGHDVLAKDKLKYDGATNLSTRKSRKLSCGKCEACRTPNCGICIYCKDIKKFGGPGKMNQACKERICENKRLSNKKSYSKNPSPPDLMEEEFVNGNKFSEEIQIGNVRSIDVTEFSTDSIQDEKNQANVKPITKGAMANRKYNSKNSIVYEESHLGWRKEIVARGELAATKKMTDPYLYSPKGKKLRSTVELLNYLIENPELCANFDPYRIHIEKTEGVLTTPNAGTTKIIQFLKMVNSGVTIEDAKTQIAFVPKPPKPKKDNAFRRKNYSHGGGGSLRHFMGPKSRRKGNRGILRRDVVQLLERHFVDNRVAPTPEQIDSWARKYEVEFELVYKWFKEQWRGKLDYEWRKAQCSDLYDSSRTREIRNFEPEPSLDDSFSFFALYDDENYEFELDDAEADYVPSHYIYESNYATEYRVSDDVNMMS